MGSISLYWSTDTEGILVDISSSKPPHVWVHWEGPDGRYDEGFEEREQAVSRILALYCSPRV
jgi:hypothetical protein